MCSRNSIRLFWVIESSSCGTMGLLWNIEGFRLRRVLGCLGCFGRVFGDGFVGRFLPWVWGWVFGPICWVLLAVRFWSPFSGRRGTRCTPRGGVLMGPGATLPLPRLQTGQGGAAGWAVLVVWLVARAALRSPVRRFFSLLPLREPLPSSRCGGGEAGFAWSVH